MKYEPSDTTGGWGRFTPEWWTEMEVQALQALAALKAATDEVEAAARKDADQL